MTNLEQYLKYKEMSDNADENGEEELSDKYMDKANKIRDEQFSKEDWEQLITLTSNYWGKCVLAQQMREKFPEQKEYKCD